MAQAPAPQGKKTLAKRTIDSFANFAASLGLQTNNISAGAQYEFSFLTRNRLELEAMYRGSWVIGMVVDAPADDMTQAGISLHSDQNPKDIEAINEAIEDLQIWPSLTSIIKWSRLYGSCLGVLLIDGQAFDTPLRLDTVRKGQFKGILPVDRWQVVPSFGELITDLGPDMGLPKYYTMTANAIMPGLGKIHHSRVIRMDAIELPFYQKTIDSLWAESVIERLYDRLVAFDSTTTGIAQLVFKAYLRTIKIKDLRTIVATGGKAYEGLVKQMDNIRRFQSSEGLTMLDMDDEFEAHNYTFAGLDDVLIQFGQQLSGAAEIPMVRMFGQSPKGMNATGESDLRNYYDSIRKKQETRLRRPVKRLLELIARSTLDKELPEGFTFKFNPLWQIGEAEKADIAVKDEQSIGGAFDRGLISQQTALKELRQSGYVSGRFSNITDEEINDADDQLPDPSEALEEEPVSETA